MITHLLNEAKYACLSRNVKSFSRQSFTVHISSQVLGILKGLMIRLNLQRDRGYDSQTIHIFTSTDAW